ncbi:glutathione S-transferase N-terminal domain-containing protein [Sphingomonas fennica]|uniref:GST N-terminal domain-containing protein n=1 Tax=Edaphosphingomonas fennica TaxID=114404 RepID=A0A2T4I7P8_9SPHN|nr:glutathione S-transferase N-terminal domain-containing protein [Sphingomonas fennica]PTD27348.1 hypothetical protein CV103_02280 [Sphingomonas fennica]
MILFHAPGASSQAAHILLREAGLPFALERVDLSTHQWSGGGDYRKLNPKAYVPALKLDDGNLLTECAVILEFIADHPPCSRQRRREQHPESPRGSWVVSMTGAGSLSPSPQPVTENRSALSLLAGRCGAAGPAERGRSRPQGLSAGEGLPRRIVDRDFNEQRRGFVRSLYTYFRLSLGFCPKKSYKFRT